MFLVLLLLALPLLAKDQDTINVTGSVYDKAIHPLANASVTLSNEQLSTTTDSNGHFTFRIPQKSAKRVQTKFTKGIFSNIRRLSLKEPDQMKWQKRRYDQGTAPYDYLVVSKDGSSVYKQKHPLIADTSFSIICNIYPSTFTDKIDSIPSYYQRDDSYGGFPFGGAVYCGPVAASNTLCWLDKKGYPLITKTGDSHKDQYDLISTLGSEKYICTTEDGSTAEDVCRGVKKFLDEKNVKADVRFTGWRWVPKEFRTQRVIPTLDMLKEGILGNKAVILNVGWFEYDPQKDEYIRDGGHWMTLVGYGLVGKKENPDALIIHDPESRRPDNQFIIMELIKSGQLTGSYDGLPRSASGYLRFKTGHDSYGVISGAVFLTIDEQPPCS